MKTILILAILSCGQLCLGWQKPPKPATGIAFTNDFQTTNAAFESLGNRSGVVINPPGSQRGEPSQGTGPDKVMIDLSQGVADSGAIRLMNHITQSTVL